MSQPEARLGKNVLVADIVQKAFVHGHFNAFAATVQNGPDDQEPMTKIIIG